ncbi:HNH endonuclease domain-containing protein [Aquirufa sp. HETE-83D]|uniref:HNH endonuclease domain-containing protein n=1 Tax=Aquirufa esocilacus TaxID=3096513 RepID=A0ABW6DLF5_9BACT
MNSPAKLNHVIHNNPGLGVEKLISVFNRTTASYKFYWLISIVELVEQGKVEIPKSTLYARMISNSWYTINYFQVSFGGSDKLQCIAKDLTLLEPRLKMDTAKEEINSILGYSDNKKTKQLLNRLGENVPHWFLSSWFPKLSKSDIYTKSQQFENDCLYALNRESILINPIWINFLISNAKLIKDFCYWNLSLYLQVRNPNVPDIPNKLIKEAGRNSLSRQTNNYWKTVFQEHGSIDCIYTGKRLSLEEKNFSLDHFVPYSFVSHDLIWNLYPIDKSENSRKSNLLPLISTHFDPFYKLQEKAFTVIKSKDVSNKFLEDFLPLSPDLAELKKEALLDTVQPLITIASNNGFQFYQKA